MRKQGEVMRRTLVGMAVGALVLTACDGGSTNQAKPAPVRTVQTPNATQAPAPSTAASKAAADHAAAVIKARQQANAKAAHARAVAHDKAVARQRAVRDAQAVKAAKGRAHARAVKAAHKKAVRHAQAVADAKAAKKAKRARVAQRQHLSKSSCPSGTTYLFEVGCVKKGTEAARQTARDKKLHGHKTPNSDCTYADSGASLVCPNGKTVPIPHCRTGYTFIGGSGCLSDEFLNRGNY
jgi:hypothetical protein